MSNAEVLDRLVPISSFNKGQASKIFERAKGGGPIIVLKNNVPAAVIVSPEEYERLCEIEEDYLLMQEAVHRLETSAGMQVTSFEDVMDELQISAKELETVDDVELA